MLRWSWTTRVCFGGVVLALVGCTDAAPADDPVAGTCDGVSRSALAAVDRKIVGLAAPYDADGALRSRDDELAGSMASRREVAWSTIQKVLEPVPLAATLGDPELPAHIPAWQSWYDDADLRRLFFSLYEALPAADKAERERFSDADLDATFLWNTTAVEELPAWPTERYEDYVAAIDEESKIAGLGGITRVSYSPGAARHLLNSYPEVLACKTNGTPPEQEVGPAVDTALERVAVEQDRCGQQRVGSYAIETDESLRVTLEGEGTLIVTAGDEVCRDEAFCELSGPATVDVMVAAGESAIRSVVDLTRRSTVPAWSSCLDGQFPLDAAIVKADYQRADFGMLMPVFDTSEDALRDRLTGAASWDVEDDTADPPPSDIYTLTLPNGTHYRLSALHVMTKELDHWLWTTLWWSPSATTDFGADRPAAIADVWSNYKMCVATAFVEDDARVDVVDESLAAALSVHEGQGAPSWCSNPYLEKGHGNAATNCIGCHQHGGTDILSEDILLRDARGTTQVRNNFPADYSWATTSGDDLGQMFADVELYFSGAP